MTFSFAAFTGVIFFKKSSIFSSFRFHLFRIPSTTKKVNISMQIAILVEIPWVDELEALREAGNFMGLLIQYEALPLFTVV